jgi:hypothetical protein
LTRITIPANVQLMNVTQLREQKIKSDPRLANAHPNVVADSRPFDERLYTAYNDNGRRAGTYVKRGGRWAYRP